MIKEPLQVFNLLTGWNFGGAFAARSAAPFNYAAAIGFYAQACVFLGAIKINARNLRAPWVIVNQSRQCDCASHVFARPCIAKGGRSSE